MSPAIPPTPDEETLHGASGPGRLLRSARESAGISVRDVSGQLRLDERTVTALETDDFIHLPAPTFVRGYLRGYARLLGVPVGPVMEAYDREGFGPPSLVADISEAPQANASDFPVRVTTIAVVAVLAVLVVMWWNNQAFDDLETDALGIDSAQSGAELPASPESTRTADAAATEQAAAAESLPTPREDDSAPAATSSAMDSTPAPQPSAPAIQAPVATAEPAAPPAIEEVIERAESVLAQTRGELDALSGALEEEAASSTAPAASDGSQASDPAAASATQDTQTLTAAPEVAPSPNGAHAAAASGDARLMLEFPIEAWVEVYAGDDERLFYDLVKPGRTLDLEGTPPMRVLLGRTQGVRATYNGEVVDLAPHTDKGVARLTLGR